VILCGGTFGSPQLLPLSGIGPADETQATRNQRRARAQGGRQNLQDHPDCITCYSSKETDLFCLTPGRRGQAGSQHVSMAQGRNRPFLVARFGRRSLLNQIPASIAPIFSCISSSPYLEDHMRKVHFGYGFSCRVCQLRPYSRGEVVFDQQRSPGAAAH